MEILYHSVNMILSTTPISKNMLVGHCGIETVGTVVMEATYNLIYTSSSSRFKPSVVTV